MHSGDQNAQQRRRSETEIAMNKIGDLGGPINGVLLGAYPATGKLSVFECRENLQAGGGDEEDPKQHGELGCGRFLPNEIEPGERHCIGDESRALMMTRKPTKSQEQSRAGGTKCGLNSASRTQKEEKD